MPEDAHALVAAARDVMRVDDASTAGLWPRAAALLGRQALEAAMARVWAITAPGMELMTARCQILCIGTMLNDPPFGGRVAVAWHTLSGGCHHGAYDLPPAAGELSAALATVWALADAAERLRAAAAR
ncbi:MAG TPA: hypothetical protein VF155_09490 [Candidatus Dormibacteraeota bacterium]